MENEEAFLRAASILKELDVQLSSVSESVINKAQGELHKEIEAHFDRCIRAIQARKETLLRDVDSKFQDKRKSQQRKEGELKSEIETCRKTLLAGVAMYNKDKQDEAVHIWKSLNEFRPKSSASDDITVKFPDTFQAFMADYGSISANSQPTRLGKSSKTDHSTKTGSVPTKLSKSSSAEPPKLNNSSNSLESPRLNKSSPVESPRLNKSSSVESPKLNKSNNSIEPLNLNKSNNSIDPPPSKLGKSSSTEVSRSSASKTSPVIDTPAPIPRLGKSSQIDGLKLDKVSNPEPIRLGKTSSTESRFGKSTDGPLKVSMESPRDSYKSTIVDSPRGAKKIASQNVVGTLTELNYGLEGRIGSNAQLRHPNGICFNPQDRCLYVCDNGHVIFKVSSAGDVKIFSAKRGDGQLHNPMGITCYHKENCFFVTSQLQHTIKMINSMGIITVVAGSGKEGQSDGLKTGFSHPYGITVDQLTGDLYVSDHGNHTIRKVSPQGVVTTLAGTVGKKGYVDGVGKSAMFNCPSDIIFNDKDQSLVVCDSNNCKIRRVALNGEVSTLGEISRPSSIAITPKGSFLVASQTEHSIYHLFKAADGYKIETIAGTGKKGSEDGAGNSSSFSNISGIALDEKSNILYVAEYEFSRIRKIQLYY